MSSIFMNMKKRKIYECYAIAFISGLLSVLALPPFNIWPILFITIPILISLIDRFTYIEDISSTQQPNNKNKIPRQKRWNIALVGWFFGFGYFFAGLYWMGIAFLVEADRFAALMPFAITIMPAGLALFYALATSIAAAMWTKGAPRIIALALGFAIAEWLRGNILTGLPWNAIAYGLIVNDGFLQLTSIVGLYGMNFFTVLFFSIPVVFLKLNLKRLTKIDYIIAFGTLTIMITGATWGYLRLNQTETKYVKNVRLRIVQPNISQKDKANPSKYPWIFSQLIKYSKQETSSDDKVTHIIWPEVAVPALLARDQTKRRAIADLLPKDVKLITGSFRIEQGKKRNKVYNSLMVFNEFAAIEAVYDKIHLVPFGEYLPFQEVLENLGFEQLTRVHGGFEAGKGKRYLELSNAPAVSPLICYEIVFPGNVIEDEARPGWLLNITNDAWFGQSTGPYQHFHQTRSRAVEEGLPVVRVANTGISAVIDPLGRVLKSINLSQAGAFNYNLPKAMEKTVYAKSRHIIFPAIIVIFLTLLYLSIQLRSKDK